MNESRRRFILSTVALGVLAGCGNIGNTDKVATVGTRIVPIMNEQIVGRKKVFIGDSITAYWPLSVYWSNTVNLGVPGEDSAAILARMDAALTAYPGAIFHIMAGTNDLTNKWEEASANIRLMAYKCISAPVPFVLCQVPPRPWLMNGLNADIVSVASQYGFPVPVDYYNPMRLNDAGGSENTALFIDGTHPNMKGYDVMAAQLAAIMPLDHVPSPSAAQVVQLFDFVG